MVYFDLDRIMIDENSFGAMLPRNWEEIANSLNVEIMDRIATTPDCSPEEAYGIAAAVWEDYCNGDLLDVPAAEEEESTMPASLSLDNGRHYITIDELEENREEIINRWNAIADLMDDDIREAVHCDLAPCDELAFLAEYLKRASEDLLI